MCVIFLVHWSVYTSFMKNLEMIFKANTESRKSLKDVENDLKKIERQKCIFFTVSIISNIFQNCSLGIFDIYFLSNENKIIINHWSLF